MLIQDTRSKQYHKLAEASPKELWAAVKATSGGKFHQACYTPHILQDREGADKYFASVCYDPEYSVDDVFTRDSIYAIAGIC